MQSTLNQESDANALVLLVKSYANANPARPEEAEQVLKMMEDRLLDPSAQVYSFVIHAYAACTPARPADAERLLKRMQEHKVQPTAQTYVIKG